MASNPDTADKFAFPKPDCNQLHAQTGMTLRDYFAAAALTGMLANTTIEQTHQKDAESAYLAADAMLKERSR